MDFRHIRAFITVADALNVTRAAERLHISQPPLTRHIHQLEHELGMALFVRHRNGVTLTDAGRRLLEKAKILEAAALDFQEAARQTTADESNTIRVGIGWGLWDAVNTIRVEFARRYPDVTIEATDAFCWYDSDERLRHHALDVAFARPPFDQSFFISSPILSERIQAILSDTHPLASKSSVRIRDLASVPLLAWDREVAPVLYDQILDLYARAGVTPTIIPTPGAGPFNHAGMMLVASGKGTYLGYGVPLTNPQGPSGVVVLPVSDPKATIDVCVVCRKADVAGKVARFLECVRDVFPQESDVPVRVTAASRRAS